ncbi:hypothetical protein BQ8794_10319 [Mesorhizobium prunaredense]|uniref:Uncharacterized protein n=1 Tax=Mesorhizobium prunaredense TaxID=1631249 RepID=A0A1R3UZ90_9HYPH|nr:hypothetical protein BQ8794_10319 [Mesorhizobium prunaredense]
MKIPHGGRVSGVTATAMSLEPIEMELVASKQGPKVYFRTKTCRRTTSLPPGLDRRKDSGFFVIWA